MKKILTIAISLLLVFAMTITSSAATIASLVAAVGTDADRTVQVTVNYNSPEEAQESTLLIVKKGVSIVTATADEIHYIDQKVVDGNSVTYSLKLAQNDRIGQYDLYVGGTKVDAPASTEINFDMDATTTIKFVNESGDEIATQVMVSSQIGDTINVGTYAPQTITSGTSIYSKDASNPSTFIASASSNTLTVTYTYLSEVREQITVDGVSYDLVTDNLIYNGDMSQTTNDGTYTYVTGWQGGYVNGGHKDLSDRPYLLEGGGWRSTANHHFIITPATETELAYVTTPAVTTMDYSEQYPYKSDAGESYMASVLTSWMKDASDVNTYLKAEAGKQYYMSFDIMASTVASWQSNVIGFTAVSENGDTYANKIPGTNGDINTLTWVLDKSIGRGRYTTTANQWVTLSTVATANSDGYFMFQLGWAFEWGQVSIRNFRIHEIEPSATNKDITVTYTVNGQTVDSKTQTINTSSVTKANFDEYYYSPDGSNEMYYAGAQSVSDNTTVAMTKRENHSDYAIGATIEFDSTPYVVKSTNLIPNGNFEYGLNGWYDGTGAVATDFVVNDDGTVKSNAYAGTNSSGTLYRTWELNNSSAKTYAFVFDTTSTTDWQKFSLSNFVTNDQNVAENNILSGTWTVGTNVFVFTNTGLYKYARIQYRWAEGQSYGNFGLYEVEVDQGKVANTTIKFVDANGAEIATAATVTGIVGDVIDLTDTTLVPEAITYNGNVYSKKSTNATSYTVVGNTDTVSITYETDAITSFDAVSVTVINGNSPILPTTIGAKTGTGSSTTVTITSWDTSSLKVGTNTVYGSVEGLTIKAEATVTVLPVTFTLNDKTSVNGQDAGKANQTEFPASISDEFSIEFTANYASFGDLWITLKTKDSGFFTPEQVPLGVNANGAFRPVNGNGTGGRTADDFDHVTLTANTNYRFFITTDASTDKYSVTVYNEATGEVVDAFENYGYRTNADAIEALAMITNNGAGSVTATNIKVYAPSVSVETYTVNAVANGSTLDSFTEYAGSTDKLGYNNEVVYPNVKIPAFDGYVFKNKTVSGSVVTLNYEAVAESAFFDNVANDTKFVSLNMLGAHDAFTAKITSDRKDAAGVTQEKNDTTGGSIGALTGAAVNKSIAQNQDVLTMLNYGVRYFDIRLSRSDVDASYLLMTAPHTNGVIYTTHGYLGEEFRPIAYTIAQWAKAHPGEIVVLDFQEYWDNTNSGDGNSRADSWTALNTLLTEAGIYDYVTINNGTDLSTVTYGSLTSDGTKAGIVLFGRAKATDASVGSFILRGTTIAAFDGKMYSNYSFGGASVSSSSLANTYIQAQVDHAYTQTGTVNNMYRVMQAISDTSNLINQAVTDNTFITNAVQTNATWLTTLPVIMVNNATVNTSDLLAILKACNEPIDVTMNYTVGGTVTDSGTAKLMIGTLYTGGVVGALYSGANGEYAVTEATTGEIPVPYNGSITVAVEKLGNVYSTRIENGVHSVYSGNLDDAAVYVGKTNFAAYTWDQDNNRLGVAVLSAEQGKTNYALSANVVRDEFNKDYRNVKFYVLPVAEYRALALNDKAALLAKLTEDTLVATINPDDYGVGTQTIALDGAKVASAAANGDVVIIGNAQGGLYGIEGSSMAIVSGYTVTVNGESTVAYGGTYTLPSEAIAYHQVGTTEVYKPAAVVEITADTEFTGYNALGAVMVDGAQVRIGEGVDENGKVSTGSGLRFITTIDRVETLASLTIDGVAMEFGVEVTAEGSDAAPVVIKAENWQVKDEVFTSAITNLAEGNYNRKFTATPYVKIGEDVYYGTAVTRSIYQVAAGLLKEGYSGGDYGQSEDESDTKYETMPQILVDVLNAYVNQTGVRLTLSDSTATATLTARLEGASGGYTGEAFFTVGETTYENGKYTVTLTAVGAAKIDVNLFNEYVRINNNNKLVSPVTTITDNGNGTYTIVFDYSKIQ